MSRLLKKIASEAVKEDKKKKQKDLKDNSFNPKLLIPFIDDAAILAKNVLPK